MRHISAPPGTHRGGSELPASLGITRVYLVLDENSLSRESLRNCIAADQNAGIKALICFAAQVEDSEALKDFGIWDDSLLCIVEVFSVGGEARGEFTITGCRFTVETAAVTRARGWVSQILSKAAPASDVLAKHAQANPMRQPLAESAPYMLKVAERECRTSYVGGASCSWYHGAWQFLRLAHVVSTPDWHTDFYRAKLRRALYETPIKRILICGSADYAMLAHVIAATEEVGGVEIVVTDICRTPLVMCDWFASHVNVPVESIPYDAMQLGFRDNWFGVVVTDAFLTRFEPADRRRLVSEWLRVLAPGGYAITTARLRATGEGHTVVASAEEAIDFATRVAQATTSHTYGLQPAEIKEMALTYANNMTSMPVTVSELRNLFSAFILEHDTVSTKGEFRSTPYLQVFARKALDHSEDLTTDSMSQRKRARSSTAPSPKGRPRQVN